MSAFMVSTDSLATIARSVATLIEFKRIAGGFAALSDESIKAIRTACRDITKGDKVLPYGESVSSYNLYRVLYNMNARSMNERYGDEVTTPEETPKFYPNASAVQLLKTIECYLYQCSEGNIPSDPLFKAIEEVSRLIKDAIINNMAEYQSANWN